MITINLGDGVVEHYDKLLTINADKVDADDIDIPPLAAITAAKKRDGGSGEPI